MCEQSIPRMCTKAECWQAPFVIWKSESSAARIPLSKHHVGRQLLQDDEKKLQDDDSQSRSF